MWHIRTNIISFGSINNQTRKTLGFKLRLDLGLLSFQFDIRCSLFGELLSSNFGNFEKCPNRIGCWTMKIVSLTIIYVALLIYFNVLWWLLIFWTSIWFSYGSMLFEVPILFLFLHENSFISFQKGFEISITTKIVLWWTFSKTDWRIFQISLCGFLNLVFIVSYKNAHPSFKFSDLLNEQEQVKFSINLDTSFLFNLLHFLFRILPFSNRLEPFYIWSTFSEAMVLILYFINEIKFLQELLLWKIIIIDQRNRS